MTSFTDTWNAPFEAIPPDTVEPAAQGASRIRTLKLAVRERLAVDHSIAGDSHDGKHKKVTLMVLAVDPTLDAGDGAVYTKDVSGVKELFWKDSAGAVYQLTRAGLLNPFVDTNPFVKGSGDATKQVRMEVDGLTTATVRTLTAPDRDVHLGGEIPSRTISGADTLVELDRGKRIRCTGTFTLSVTAAATLGAGWYCWVFNAGTGVITIDPNGSETIDIPGGPNTPGTTITLPYSGSVEGPYNVSGILLFCSGTGFSVLSTAEAHGQQEFLSSGTWTAPAGVTSIWVDACAAGGGGGSTTNDPGGQNSAGGGGAGEAITGQRFTVIPGTAYTVTIGAGGAAATVGGNTSLGALITLTGGNLGATSGTSTSTSGGANRGRGGAGHPGVVGTVAIYGGNGGSGPFGGGARGGRVATGGSGTTNGESAANNSGAGGGGAASVDGGPSTGGTGGSGYMKIRW